MKTLIDKKYENSFPLLVFFGGIFFSLFCVIITAGSNPPVFGILSFSITCFAASFILAKAVLKRFKYLDAETNINKPLVGFLNLIDILGILVAICTTTLYLTVKNSLVNNLLCFIVAVIILQVVEIKKMYHITGISIFYCILYLVCHLRLINIYGYALDTFTEANVDIPLHFQAKRVATYAFNSKVTVGLIEIVLLGFFIKFLRCFDKLYANGTREFSRKKGIKKNIGINTVALVGVVIGCIVYSLLLTRYAYPVGLFLAVYPIVLILVIIYTLYLNQIR